MVSKIIAGLKLKAVRMINSFRPVSGNRTGKCVSCGECCKLPITCPFLRYDKKHMLYCAAYSVRPPNCRKYPRTASEFITQNSCGFKFS